VPLGAGVSCHLDLVDESSFTLVFTNHFDRVAALEEEEAETEAGSTVEEGSLHVVGTWERNERFLSLLVKDLREYGSAASRNGLPLRISDFVQQGGAAPIVPDGCENLHCNVNTAPIYLWFYVLSPVQLLSRMLQHAAVGQGRDRSCDMLWVFGPKAT
jgi:hypothetical protein